MSAPLAPCLALAALAWAVATWRVYVLSWSAPLDDLAFRRALEAHLTQGDPERAIALCRALSPAWMAECTAALLRARSNVAGDELTLEELQAAYAFKARAGLGLLWTVSRMALPLALGSAIFVLSGAFTATGDLAHAQSAVQTALACVSTGVLTVFFCRTALEILQQQAGARVREIRALAQWTHVCVGQNLT